MRKLYACRLEISLVIKRLSRFAYLDRLKAIIIEGLRTNMLFKTEFRTESYIYCPMTRAHRRSDARFHCGVAPLRLETGRYEGLAEPERVCFNC